MKNDQHYKQNISNYVYNHIISYNIISYVYVYIYIQIPHPEAKYTALVCNLEPWHQSDQVQLAIECHG